MTECDLSEIPQEGATQEKITPSNRTRGTRRATGYFLGLAVCAGTAAAGLFLQQYVVNVPYADDWAFAPLLAGSQPLTAGWLWAQHNEHRIPLPRLLSLLVLRLTGGDFRAMPWVNLILLALLTILLLRAVRFLRGDWKWHDLAIPLMFLHLGHADNLLWGFQIQFISSTFLAGWVLSEIVRNPGGPNRHGSCGRIGAALCGLTLCGGNGIVFVPLLTGWMCYASIANRGTAASRSLRIMQGIVPAAAVGLTAAYFLGIRRIAQGIQQPGAEAILSTAMQFLITGLSVQLIWFWPWGGLLMPTLLLSATWRLIVVWWREPAERIRAAGLLCLLGGVWGLAAGIGWGRAELGMGAGLMPRYVTLATFGLVITYITTVLYGNRWRTILGSFLCAVLAVVYTVNVPQGLEWGAERANAGRAFSRDLVVGVPAADLGDKYARGYFPQADVIAKQTLHLREARIGLFQPVAGDAQNTVEDLDLHPVSTHDMQWEYPHATAQREGASLEYRLAQPRFVQRIYLGLTRLDRAAINVPVRIVWLGKPGIPGTNSPPSSAEFSVGVTPEQWLPSDDIRQQYLLSFPVQAEIEQFSFEVRRIPCEFRLHRVEVLRGTP